MRERAQLELGRKVCFKQREKLVQKPKVGRACNVERTVGKVRVAGML